MFVFALALLVQPVPADDVTQAESMPDEGQAVLQEAEDIATAPADAAIDAQPAPELILPKGHQIVIVIDAQIGSKISQTGQMFPIRLAQPVVVDGVEILPAGITGEGQVVHAKKGGMAGSAGELVLAARYLDHAGRRIDLRSFKFIEEGDEILSHGKDNVGLANATNAVIGPLGFLIGGGNTTIEPGTLATAKTRNDESFAVAGDSPASPGSDN